MRRFFLGTLVLAAAVLPSLPAAAQKSGDPVRVQVLDFGATVIDGHTKGPATLITDSHGRPKFARLYAAQKSFLRELVQSGSDPALK